MSQSAKQSTIKDMTQLEIAKLSPWIRYSHADGAFVSAILQHG